MADNLNEEEAQLLKSALSTAFSPAGIAHKPITIQEVAHENAPQPPAPTSTEQAPESSSASLGDSPPAEEEWKAEYEAHVAEWRQRSAEQRQHAEEQRARWEAIRQREREEAASRRDTEGSMSGTDSGWESVSGTAVVGAGTSAAVSGSPSPVDARDLVTGESQKHSDEYLERVLPGASNASHDRERNPSEPHMNHEKWEDVAVPSSLTSSYPSLSYPSGIHTPLSHPHPDPHHDPTASARAMSQPQVSRGATYAALDTTLSRRSRVLAVLSSIAINVLLPFVNGVMLGFGEIFAKNVVVKWFGWKPANSSRFGDVVAGVGLRKNRQGETRSKNDL